MALRKTVIASALTCLLLTACGGGGKDLSGNGTTTNSSSSSSSSTTTTTTGTYKLELSLKTCTDIATLSTCKEQTTTPATLPADKPNLVEVTLVDDKSKPVAGAVVDISTSEYAVGSIQGATRALTDATGKARFVLIANASNGNQVGKVGITATYTSSSGTAGTLTQSKTFEFGALDLSMALTANPTDLSAGSTASITAKLTNSGSVYTTPVTVSFSSSCATNKTATLDASKITTDGSASVTYKGSYTATDGTTSACTGNDTITASVGNLVKTVSINNLATKATTLIASDPTPTIIYLPGSGFTSQSSITFTVLDINKQPKSMERVNFSLGGGMDSHKQSYQLEPSSATTDSNGQVTVTLKAGSMAMTVPVIATLDSDSSKNAYSKEVVVMSGLPVAGKITVNPDVYNIEGWPYDNEKITIGLTLLDRDNHYVPNGTKVTLLTDLGGIKGDLSSENGVTGYCTTVDGKCTAVLSSSEPRISLDTNKLTGRVHVLAYVTGEESFTDIDGVDTTSGEFDLGDIAGSDVDEPYFDLDNDGVFTSSTDIKKDVNNDGVHNNADGLYTGMHCSKANNDAGICKRETVRLYTNKLFTFTGVVHNVDGSGNGMNTKIDIQECATQDPSSCLPLPRKVCGSGGTPTYDLITNTATCDIYDCLAADGSDTPDGPTCAVRYNEKSIDLTGGAQILRFRPATIVYENGTPTLYNALPAKSTMTITTTNGGTKDRLGSADYSVEYPGNWVDVKDKWFWFRFNKENPVVSSTGDMTIKLVTPKSNSVVSDTITIKD